MRILFYQWNAFMQKDMEIAFKRMNIEYKVFSFPFREKKETDELMTGLRRELNSTTYDALFSFNYRDEIAECAHEAGIVYIAWVYDCPFGISENEEILKYNTNHIFVFDGYTYRSLRDRGIQTVYHMDLAVNTSRVDRITLSVQDHKKYDANIAFVGKLYSSSFIGFLKRITEEQKGFVDRVIDEQSSVQGQYLLHRLTSDEAMLEGLQRTLEGEYHGYDWVFHESLQSLLAKEITRRDRVILLLFLSEIYDGVALYTDCSDPLLTRVDMRGTVSSFEELFKTYKAARINLNITFRRIATGIPLRVLEILGAGGFLLTNRQEEIVESFRPDEELVIYDGFEEAADKVGYYLSHEEERRKIAENGHEAVKRFSYENQWKKIMRECGFS